MMLVPCCSASSYHRPGAERCERPRAGPAPPRRVAQTGPWSGRRGLAAAPSGARQRNRAIIAHHPHHSNKKSISVDTLDVFIIICHQTTIIRWIHLKGIYYHVICHVILFPVATHLHPLSFFFISSFKIFLKKTNSH